MTHPEGCLQVVRRGSSIGSSAVSPRPLQKVCRNDRSAEVYRLNRLSKGVKDAESVDSLHLVRDLHRQSS